MRLGSDATGTAMGLLTIPIALLSVAGMAAGLVLAARQEWAPLALGAVAFVFAALLAWPLERLVVAVDDLANVAMKHRLRSAARAAAVVSGALPLGVILAAETECLRGVMEAAGTAPRVAAWLWGYVAATGPWTLFAGRISRFRRTLVAIRAYAGHIALWLFSLLLLGFHASPAAASAAMLLPAILPFTVGYLLALADRDAIANVRV